MDGKRLANWPSGGLAYFAYRAARTGRRVNSLRRNGLQVSEGC
jgi:hypothetical protein